MNLSDVALALSFPQIFQNISGKHLLFECILYMVGFKFIQIQQIFGLNLLRSLANCRKIQTYKPNRIHTKAKIKIQKVRSSCSQVVKAIRNLKLRLGWRAGREKIQKYIDSADLRSILNLDGADLVESSLHDVRALQHELTALSLEVLLLPDRDLELAHLLHLLSVHGCCFSRRGYSLQKKTLKYKMVDETNDNHDKRPACLESA